MSVSDESRSPVPPESLKSRITAQRQGSRCGLKGKVRSRIVKYFVHRSVAAGLFPYLNQFPREADGHSTLTQRSVRFGMARSDEQLLP